MLLTFEMSDVGEGGDEATLGGARVLTKGRTLDLLWARRGGGVCVPGLPGLTSRSTFVPFICPRLQV